VRLGRQSSGPLEQDLYYELRYEAIIAYPPEECAKLCKFLDVPYEDDMLHFRKGWERTELILDAKTAWQLVTSGLRLRGSGMARAYPSSPRRPSTAASKRSTSPAGMCDL
jgi:hypothetical protein